MPVTSKHVLFSYTDSASAPQSFEIAIPAYPYKYKIYLPFDFASLDNASWDVYDNSPGVADIRQCECTFVIDATDITAFRDAFGTDSKARGRECSITMASASGFFPYGHDKGDVGAFTGTLEIIKDYGIVEAPYLYYKVDVLLTNTGNYPAYSIPTDVSDDTDGMTIGSVANIRFPQSFFQPQSIYGCHTAIMQGGVSKFFNRGTGADRYSTSFDLWMSSIKAAHVVDELTRVIRNNAFSFIAQTNWRPFGLDKGTGGTYSVKLLNDSLEVTVDRFNSAYLQLGVGYVSGPT